VYLADEIVPTTVSPGLNLPVFSETLILVTGRTPGVVEVE